MDPDRLIKNYREPFAVATNVWGTDLKTGETGMCLSKDKLVKRCYSKIFGNL